MLEEEEEEEEKKNPSRVVDVLFVWSLKKHWPGAHSCFVNVYRIEHRGFYLKKKVVSKEVYWPGIRDAQPNITITETLVDQRATSRSTLSSIDFLDLFDRSIDSLIGCCLYRLVALL